MNTIEEHSMKEEHSTKEKWYIYDADKGSMDSYESMNAANARVTELTQLGYYISVIKVFVGRELKVKVTTELEDA